MTPRTDYTLSDGSPLSAPEHFVLKQAAAGEIADLQQEFGDVEDKRRLRARFLEELLTGDLPGVRLHRRGVRISRAVIAEPLDLENAEVAVAVALRDCIFKEWFSIIDACFSHHLSLIGSQFVKRAGFHRLNLAGGIFCRNTVFAGGVDFGHADIKGQFMAQGAKFLTEDQEANFNGLQVGKGAFFNGAEFYGAVDFAVADMKGQFVAKGAKFLGKGKEQGANFNGLQVGQGAFFDGTEFHGPVDFGSADIKGQLGQFTAKGAKFLAKSPHKANFNALKVGQVAFFDGAEFHGPVDFVAADIKGQFAAKGAKFLAEDREANFYSMRVGQDASFAGVEFHGPVDLGGAEIMGQFGAQGAKFLGANHNANFAGMQVDRDAFFQACDFQGLVSFVTIKVAGDLHLEPLLLKIGQEMSTTFRSGVNFRGAEIGGEFSADKVQFLGHISDFEAVQVGRNFHGRGSIFVGAARFIGMEVKNDFNINPYIGPIKNKTLFKGAADFSRVEVSGLFNANQAIFKSENVVFSGIKVGLGATFKGTIFFAGLAIEDGELSNLEINGLHKLQKGAEIALPLAEIVLKHTRIAHRLIIEDIEAKRFDARNLEVKGAAELRRLVIKDEADLRDASCHHLQIAKTTWPEPKDGQKRVYLDGLTYQSLTTEPEAKSKEGMEILIDWLQHSHFNTQNYGQLDSFFQRGGHRKPAYKVFISGKRRELGEMAFPFRWLIGLFWGLLAGYGRKPGRTFWPALVLVLLGWLVFHAAGQPLWNGLAASLDRFLPGVDLGVARAFQPASPSNYVWAYWHLEKIMGWVLAPIALAAIYTRIK
jgi:uncharacterized protein YjbI with pentapeptide repeats